MKIRIPTFLCRYSGGERLFETHAVNVGAALRILTETHPELKPHLIGDDDEVQPFVNVYLNDTNIRDLTGLQTPLSESDELILVPTIAGG